MLASDGRGRSICSKSHTEQVGRHTDPSPTKYSKLDGDCFGAVPLLHES